MAKIQDPKIAGLVGSANHALRDALAPFVEEQFRKKDEENWIEYHQARREAEHAERLREIDGKIAWDAYGVLRSIDIDFSYVFRRAFQDRGCEWKYIQSVVVQLVKLRNLLIGHPTDVIDDTQALLFLTHCRELFEAVKNREYARHVGELLAEMRITLANRGSYDQNTELSLSNDDYRIANRYTTDEVLENQCKRVIKQLQKGLAERGWRLDSMERGERAWGCTNPDLNLTFLCERPTILLHVLDFRWLAYEHCPENLRTYVIAQAKRENSDFRNDSKVRIASDFFELKNNFVDIQETDYLSSAMTDQLRWARVRSKRVSADGQPAEVLWDGASEFIEMDGGRGVATLKGFKDSLISKSLSGEFRLDCTAFGA
jgi:hypothetical protein